LKFLRNIRYRLAKKNLSQEHHKLIRQRKPHNLDSARTIALLYYLPDEDTYKKVEEFIRLFTEKGIKVRVVSYTDQKITPHYFIPKLMQDILTIKDINWQFTPVKPFVKDFLEEEFDILINLSLTEQFPLLYLSAKARASLKIGKFDEEQQEYYDLMIEIPSDSDLSYFTEQVLFYLKKINTET